jgi:heme-degrading monooxygenase HmoA
MTRSVIYFHFDEPGARAKFLETFQRINVLEVSSFQAGYLGGQLHAAVGDEKLAMVIADWESPESYQGWLDNPERERVGEQLRPFVTSEPIGQVFEVLHDVAPRTPVQA